MILRHQKEILELKNAQLFQQKLLLDKKQNSLLPLSQNTHPFTPINQLRNTNYIGNDTPSDAQESSQQLKFHAIFSTISNRVSNEFNSISPISSGSWDQQLPPTNLQYGGNSVSVQTQNQGNTQISGLMSPYEQGFQYGSITLPSDNTSSDILNSVIQKLQSQNNVAVEDLTLNSQVNNFNEVRGGIVSPKNSHQNDPNYQGFAQIDTAGTKKPLLMVNNEYQSSVNKIISPRSTQGERQTEPSQMKTNSDVKMIGQTAEHSAKKQETRFLFKAQANNESSILDPKSSGNMSLGVSAQQQNAPDVGKIDQRAENEHKDASVKLIPESSNNTATKSQEKDTLHNAAVAIISTKEQSIEERTKNISIHTDWAKGTPASDATNNPSIRLTKEIPRIEIEINDLSSPKNKASISSFGSGQHFSPREIFKQTESMTQKNVLSPTATDPYSKKSFDFFQNKGQKVSFSIIEKLKVSILSLN